MKKIAALLLVWMFSISAMERQEELVPQMEEGYADVGMLQKPLGQAMRDDIQEFCETCWHSCDEPLRWVAKKDLALQNWCAHDRSGNFSEQRHMTYQMGKACCVTGCVTCTSMSGFGVLALRLAEAGIISIKGVAALTGLGMMSMMGGAVKYREQVEAEAKSKRKKIE